MKPRTAAAFAAAVLLPLLAHAEPPADKAAIWTFQDESAAVTLSPLTDRFYTNGLRLGWTSPTGAVPDVLASLGRFLWGAGQQRVGFGLSHQIYTPANTQANPADPFDRPYAGYLTANVSLLSDTDRSRSLLLFSAGVVGPAAGGEALQNFVHSVIGQSADRGWGSQIPNTRPSNCWPSAPGACRQAWWQGWRRISFHHSPLAWETFATTCSLG